VAHEGGKIRAVEVNGGRNIAVDKLVSTLPCNMFIGMLDPAPPEDIARHAARIRFRSIILAALFLDRDSVTKSATVYFPAPESPFTRVYEPKNRSAGMSPHGKTSLVAEIPCDQGGRFWKMDDSRLVEIVLDELQKIGWAHPKQVLGSRIARVPFAYPVIENETRHCVAEIQSYLEQFENLRISGRGGMFRYSWIHNMIRNGKDMV
jgi:protoporphyrinogen oxidase